MNHTILPGKAELALGRAGGTRPGERSIWVGPSRAGVVGMPWPEGLLRELEEVRPAAARQLSVWISDESQGDLERWYLALLVLASVIGIAYGFLCFTGLVENWAGTQGVIEHTIKS